MIYLVVKKNREKPSPQFPVFVSDDMVCVGSEIAEAVSGKEKALLEVLDNLPYGLFTTGQGNRVDYFNAAAERITGVSASDAIGKHCSEVFRSSVCNEDCTLHQSGKTGKDVFICEFEIMRPDGRILPIICTTCTLTGHDGAAIDKTMYVFKDILDRKRLKDDLKNSEHKYRRLFDGSKDLIFITSKQGIFKDMNQACVDLLGYDGKEELFGLQSAEKVFSNPMHWRVFREQIDRYGFVKDYEASFRKKDGTPIYCLMSGDAVEDVNGEIVGYEGIAKDITARMDGVRHLQQQYRKLSLIHAVAVAMNATQHLDDILMVALKKALSGLGLRSGGIFLIDQEKDFALKVHYGFASSVTAGTAQVRIHDRALMRFLLKGTLPLSTLQSFPPFKATLKESGGSNLELTCFLITRKDRASGFLALEVPPERRIGEPDQRILGSLGNFLGSAIENSRLLQTVHQHREDLKQLTARLFNSQEEERRRIARELHDEAGQALTGINYALENICKNIPPEHPHIIEEIAEVKKQISRTYQDMRSMSYRLHPAVLSDLGLEPALESYLHSVRRYSGLEIDFRMIGFEQRLDPEIETVLYRVSQEIITNALKHSGAELFRLSIIKGYPNIIYVAEDDGVGFDMSKSHGQGLGLLGIRERLALIGGTFSIRSSVGRGTKIRIEIPVKENSREQ